MKKVILLQKVSLLSLLFSMLISTALIAQDKPAPDLKSEPKIDGFPASMQPWRDKDNPLIENVSEGWDLYFTRRDTSNDPQREAGPIDLQRYEAVSGINGFPTFMGMPVALNKEDLIAGKVDVAYLGCPSWFQPSGGTQWAANQMRMIRSYDHGKTGHDMHLNVNYFEVLNVVDYGNANQNPLMFARNMADQALVIRDIIEAGAIPMIMGGDHGTQVATIMALVDHYGPQTFAMVHFDAHFDMEDFSKSFGSFTHGARARRFAHEQGWVKGEDLHSIGIRSPYHSPKLLKFIKEIGDQYHYMAEFERRGFEATWAKAREELKGKKLYISVDIDVLEASDVPGTSNPEPGGISPAEMMQMIRELAIQNEVLLIDFVEYSPLMDDRHYNTALVINRMMRSFLAGTAARKLGITDPTYIDPISLDHK